MIGAMLSTPCVLLAPPTAEADEYGDLHPVADEDAVRYRTVCHAVPSTGRDAPDPGRLASGTWRLFFAPEAPVQPDSVVLLEDGTRITITEPARPFRIGGTGEVHHLEAVGMEVR